MNELTELMLQNFSQAQNELIVSITKNFGATSTYDINPVAQEANDYRARKNLHEYYKQHPELDPRSPSEITQEEDWLKYQERAQYAKDHYNTIPTTTQTATPTVTSESQPQQQSLARDGSFKAGSIWYHDGNSYVLTEKTARMLNAGYPLPQDVIRGLRKVGGAPSTASQILANNDPEKAELIDKADNEKAVEDAVKTEAYDNAETKPVQTDNIVEESAGEDPTNTNNMPNLQKLAIGAGIALGVAGLTTGIVALVKKLKSKGVNKTKIKQAMAKDGATPKELSIVDEVK